MEEKRLFANALKIRLKFLRTQSESFAAQRIEKRPTDLSAFFSFEALSNHNALQPVVVF